MAAVAVLAKDPAPSETLCRLFLSAEVLAKRSCIEPD